MFIAVQDLVEILIGSSFVADDGIDGAHVDVWQLVLLNAGNPKTQLVNNNNETRCKPNENFHLNTLSYMFYITAYEVLLLFYE